MSVTKWLNDNFFPVIFVEKVFLLPLLAYTKVELLPAHIQPFSLQMEQAEPGNQ